MTAMTTARKYPRITTRMTRDAIDLRRAVADLQNALAQARKSPQDDAAHERVWRASANVERLATCLRADAIEIGGAE